jgi:hypothetical protein
MVPTAGLPVPHNNSVKLADSVAALDEFIAILLKSSPDDNLYAINYRAGN